MYTQPLFFHDALPPELGTRKVRLSHITKTLVLGLFSTVHTAGVQSQFLGGFVRVLKDAPGHKTCEGGAGRRVAQYTRDTICQG